MKSIRKIRRIARLPKVPRNFLRFQDAPITKNRRLQPIEFGDDPLEQRAIPKDRFPGATLPERIVYKKLAQLIGEDKFIYQRSEFGGRAFIGGYVLDFVVLVRQPPILLEVEGQYWHQKKDEYRDIQRATVMVALGFEYHEIWEYDIYQSDENLERILRGILDRYAVTRVAY